MIPFELDKVHCCDCLEALKLLPDKSVDLVLTDPPYGVGYEGGLFHSGDVQIQRKRKAIASDDNNVYPSLFSQSYRLLKNGSGGAYVFFADAYSHYCIPPAPFAKYQLLIWGKSNAKYAAMMARYKHNYEPFLWLQKPPTKWRGATTEPALWWMDRDPANDMHPTQKPVELIKRMIRNSTDEGDLILDPFMGSGTTGVAAVQLGRQFLGFEIDPEYCQLANDRIDAARKGLKLNEYRQGQQTLFGETNA